LKDDLVSAIDAELKSNATKHQNNKAFTEYYSRAPRTSTDAPEEKKVRRKTLTATS
jgi:hypothetical protein